jgi:CheY-like chemotaxis protein
VQHNFEKQNQEDDKQFNILVVDDRQENILAIESILEGLGQNLVRATSGKEALRKLLDEDFVMILMDVQMPVMDGYETSELIRQHPKLRNTPIIFVTAYSSEESNISRGYELGAVDFIFKPVVPEILKSKVKVFIELAKKNELLRQQAIAKTKAEAERAELERELQSLKELTDGTTKSISDLSRGQQALHESAPDVFDRLVKKYGILLDNALERQMMKVEIDVSDGLQELAEKLGSRGSGPRDVVDVHTTSLRAKCHEATPQKAQAYVKESRLTVLELMGHVVTYYRSKGQGISGVKNSKKQGH